MQTIDDMQAIVLTVMQTIGDLLRHRANSDADD